MGFAVDLDGLTDLVADIGTFDDTVARQIADLEREIATLHTVWAGQAATAQLAAHHRLREGLAWMRAGLAEMQAAGRTAHGNYSAAVASNLRMMSGLT